MLGQLEEPLDKGTIAQLLKALGPLGGPPLGMVTLEWMLEAGWEGACSLHAFNALLALCDRCCHDKKTAFEVTTTFFSLITKTVAYLIQQ